MTDELILTNARIVLDDEVILGSVQLVDGRIADIGAPFSGGTDLEGDYLLPGLVELHTDHLESHYAPRPGVRWNPMASVQAHDAQVASSGITTVLDALRVGLNTDDGMTPEDSPGWARRSTKASRPAGSGPSTISICAARWRRPTASTRSGPSRATSWCGSPR